MAGEKPKNKTSKSEQERLQLKEDVKKWGRRQREIEEQEAKEQAEQKAKDLEAKLRYLFSGNAVYKSREKDFKSFKKKYELTEEGKSIQDILLGFTGATAENFDFLKGQVLYVIYQFKNYDRDKDSFDLQKNQPERGS